MANRKHIFTPLEKKVFIELLKKHSNIIESKNTDGASLRAKNETWEKVTREYNASAHATVQVSAKQLRRLWMNLKQRQREAIGKERQFRSGGLGTTIQPTFQRSKHAFLENEYQERQRRANEIHELEVLLLREKIREAKAKADLAETLLHSADMSPASGNDMADPFKNIP